MNINKIELSGKLFREPECRSFGDGQTLTSFSLSVSHKEKGEWKSGWVKVITFDPVQLYKDLYVHVVGRLQLREYTAKDGTKKTSVEIVANQVTQIEAPSKSAPQQNTTRTQQQARTDHHSSFSPLEDDMPF